MPARSKIAQLPGEVRAELDRRLVEGAFGGYDDLAAWMAEAGFEISRSAIHRHGQELERRIDAIRIATEQAQTLVTHSPDDQGAVADAVLRMAQERIFQVLMAGGEGADLKQLSAATRALAESVRAATSVRAERRKALAEARDIVNDEGRAQGVSDTVLAAIDARLMPGD